MATQLAERTASPITVFRQTLTQPAFREQLKMALPSHIPEDRFIRVALTAAQQNPDLLNPQKVDRNSLFGALIRSAQDGLLPDGREGAIIPFKGRAQWMPMVNGIMKKVRNSGEIASWEAAAVYERDQFQRLLGDDQRIYHEPFEDGDPGEVIGAYSIVTFKDGTKSRDYMPRWRIEKARDESMTPPQGYKPVEVEAEPPAPLSRLDAIEHSIEQPPVEPEAISEQAEELEAVIDDAPTGSTLAEQLGLDDPHPGEAKAAALIAEIEEAIAIVDVDSLLSSHKADIEAMPSELGASVEIAADKRRQEIKAERAKAKEGVE
jgi:phage RecT family recombinase